MHCQESTRTTFKRLFSEGIRIILSTLRYRHALIETKKGDQSNLIPDITLAKQGVTQPGLQDVLAIVELKSPNVIMRDAVVQAAKYLFENSKFRINNNHPLSSLIAIGSNYTDICIFGVSKQDLDPKLQLYRRTQSPCFPKGWKNMKTPTDGFIELCHAIH